MFQSIPIEYYAYTGLLNAVLFSAMAVWVYFKKPDESVARYHALISSSVAFWAFMYFLWLSVNDNPELAGFLERTCMIGIIWLPTLMFQFTRELTGYRQKRWLLRASYFLSSIISLLVYTKYFATGVTPVGVFPYWLEPGILLHVHVAQTYIVALFSFYVLWVCARKEPDSRKKNQFYWILGGYSTAFLLGAVNYLSWYRIPFPPVFNIVIPAVFVSTAYAIVKHQLMDIRIVVKRSLVYSSLLAIITAVYLVVVLIIERQFQGLLGYESIIFSVGTAFVIAIFFNPMRNWIQHGVDRAFFQATPVELAEQRDQLLEEVRKTEHMKAVATLAAGLAHEIKNPLTSIKIFTEELDVRGSDPEFQKKFKRIVGGEVERIQQTVQQLLDFAKPDLPRLEQVEVTDILDEVLDLLSSELANNQIKIIKTYKDSPAIHADRKHLKQVFLNLLLNSLQAIDKQGRIEVCVESNDNQLVVYIKDNGCGISKEGQSKVFDPFYTTKSDGTGLGLSVVRSIMREHGGEVSISSIPNCSTEFSLTFPINGVER